MCLRGIRALHIAICFTGDTSRITPRSPCLHSIHVHSKIPGAWLLRSIMVRRLKSEVLTQLPRKRRQQVMLDLDEDAKKQLAGLQKQVRQGQAAREGSKDALLVAATTGVRDNAATQPAGDEASWLDGRKRSSWHAAPVATLRSWRLCGR